MDTQTVVQVLHLLEHRKKAQSTTDGASAASTGTATVAAALTSDRLLDLTNGSPRTMPTAATGTHGQRQQYSAAPSVDQHRLLRVVGVIEAQRQFTLTSNLTLCFSLSPMQVLRRRIDRCVVLSA